MDKGTNEFKHYPFPESEGEKFRIIQSRIESAIEKHFLQSGVHVNNASELPDEILEDAILDGIYIDFLRGHTDDIDKEKIKNDTQMLQGLKEQIKKDKNWKDKREIGQDRKNVGQEDKVLDEVEMYTLFFKSMGGNEKDKTLDGYEKFLKAQLGDEKFASSKQGYMAKAIESEISTKKEEFIQTNREKYIEYLKTVFSPEQGHSHTTGEVRQATESLRYSGLDLGVKLEGNVNEPTRPRALIFQVQSGTGWVELGRIKADDNTRGQISERGLNELGAMHDRTNNNDSQAENEQTGIDINVVNKTGENQINVIAKKLISENPKEWQFNRDYPPLSADNRVLFCKGLYEARELLSNRADQQYEAQAERK